jgi:hypothetical protein
MKKLSMVSSFQNSFITPDGPIRILEGQIKKAQRGSSVQILAMSIRILEIQAGVSKLN